tara:strand:- start:1892 stop:2104 length:213 start_codon:yes stop_codon:yes gene_type:complete
MTKNKYRIVLVEWDEVVDQLNYPEGFDNKGFQKGIFIYKNKQQDYPTQIFWYKDNDNRFDGLADYVAHLS